MTVLPAWLQWVAIAELPVLLALVGAIWRLHDRALREARKAADEARANAKGDAKLLVSGELGKLHGELGQTLTALADFRLNATKEFATWQGLREVEQRLQAMLERMDHNWERRIEALIGRKLRE